MRVVVVPGALALLPAYASIDDPVAGLRRACLDAAAWLVEDGPAAVLAASPGARRVAEHLLGARHTEGPNLLVVANGSATRTEKAPGHFDERASAFDAAVGAALAAADLAALGDLDLALADELWALPDADLFRTLAGRVAGVDSVQVDYDDAPYGVQYWVTRWRCRPSRDERCAS